MAGVPNTEAIYSRQGSVSSDGTDTNAAAMAPTITTATGDYTGVSANHKVAWTANSENGGMVQKLRFKAIGTNVVSVARIYINNGSDPTVATNNSFYGEQTLPATTASNVQGTIEVDYPINVALPPGYRIVVGLGTTVAAGWVVTGVGGKY